MSGAWRVQLQGGGGSQRGALGTDDNAADARATPRGPGVIQTTGPSRPPRHVTIAKAPPRVGTSDVRGAGGGHGSGPAGGCRGRGGGAARLP
ncbi:hypothetical protein CVT30_12100 [Streptomyces sp. AMCC400023]|nr:hypothetical protein CVT30_12100 [Streptomyces sp. AMCC400023]